MGRILYSHNTCAISMNIVYGTKYGEMLLVHVGFDFFLGVESLRRRSLFQYQGNLSNYKELEGFHSLKSPTYNGRQLHAFRVIWVQLDSEMASTRRFLSSSIFIGFSKTSLLIL